MGRVRAFTGAALAALVLATGAYAQGRSKPVEWGPSLRPRPNGR
jgi:hypothetical protein